MYCPVNKITFILRVFKKLLKEIFNYKKQIKVCFEKYKIAIIIAVGIESFL